MGKVTIFQCDYCGEAYKIASQVKIMDGSILDGDGNVVFEGDGENLIICNHCLVKKFEKITEEVKEEIVEEIEEDVSKKKLLKKIKNMKDEDEFIKNIGYVGRDNFTKVYKESLVDHYYPIDAAEDDKELDIMSFNISIGLSKVKEFDIKLNNFGLSIGQFPIYFIKTLYRLANGFNISIIY